MQTNESHPELILPTMQRTQSNALRCTQLLLLSLSMYWKSLMIKIIYQLSKGKQRHIVIKFDVFHVYHLIYSQTNKVFYISTCTKHSKPHPCNCIYYYENQSLTVRKHTRHLRKERLTNIFRELETLPKTS